MFKTAFEKGMTAVNTDSLKISGQFFFCLPELKL